MTKRKIMRAFKINEISAVDKPAQQGARMVIMKRGDDNDLTDEDLVEKRAVLTTNEEGHSHLIYSLDESGGTTSYSKMGDEEYGHSHPYVITDEGDVIIGESDGHTHDVKAFGKGLPVKVELGKKFYPSDYAYIGDIYKMNTWKLRLTNSPGGEPDPRTVSAAVTALEKCLQEVIEAERPAVILRVSKAWLTANPDKTEEDLPDILKAQSQTLKENDMTLDELKKAHKEQTEKLTADLAKAMKLAELTDGDKAYYSKLDDKAKEAFLAKSADERKAEITKATEGDPVMYKADNGTEYRKSAGEAVIALAKQADEATRTARTEKAARENLELQKRAEETFKNLPGTVAEKAELLKSLESIPDEAARKSAIAAVKAGDNAMSDAFKRSGAGGGSGTDSTATNELDTMAKNYAKEKNVDFAKAYTHVIQTPEGKKLYEQTIQH